jgi:cytochrome c oxidase assembly factor CtaG
MGRQASGVGRRASGVGQSVAWSVSRVARALPQSTHLFAVSYAWTFDPGPIVAVGVAGTVYVARWLRVRREDGPRGAGGWRLVSFLSGLALILVALVSPVDALGDQIFFMHMTQHIVLLDLAPILCILGLTRVLLRPATRRIHRIEQAAGFLAHPVFAIVLYAATIWTWHVPALYDAALRHPLVHVFEHLTFLSAGLLFWWHLLSPIRSRFRLGGLGPVAYVAATKLLVGALGMAITFSPDLLYDWYARFGTIWGMSPLAGQQAGGALMTVEQETILGIVLITLFVRALGEEDRKEARAERYGGEPAADT